MIRRDWLYVALSAVGGLLFLIAAFDAFGARAAPHPLPVSPPAAAAKPWPFTPKSARLLMLMDKAHPTRSPDGRQMWALSADLTYRTHAGDTIIIPKGMATDLTSIPRLLQNALPTDGVYVQAAVVHDFLYRSSGTCVLWRNRPRTCSRKANYTRAEADQILDDAMADLGVGRLMRVTIWSGVRIGGQGGWSH